MDDLHQSLKEENERLREENEEWKSHVQAFLRHEDPEALTLWDKAETQLAEARAELSKMREAAKFLDDLLLRFAFDAGAIGDDVVASLGVDPWGSLGDFRRTFGLAPNQTAEEAARALAPEAEEEKPRILSIEGDTVVADVPSLRELEDELRPSQWQEKSDGE